MKFEDIRQGDRIRLGHVEFGVKTTREGVAHERHSDGAWYTREGGYIASPAAVGTILLLRRPVPAEPKDLGAVVRAVVGGNKWYFHRIGTGERPWINLARNWHDWSDFDPESIEVLSEGIEIL